MPTRALFLVLDTVRRDYLRCYGNTWVHTPNLSRLAERGVVFDNHWAGSLPCMPARREFMTGRYNFLYRGWGPIEPFDDTLPKWLRQRRNVFSHLLTDHDHYFELGGENYHTAFNTWEFFRGQEHDAWASHVDRVALPPDWNVNRQGKDKHLGQNFLNRLRWQREEDFSGPRTCSAAVDWLDTNKDAKGDWFLQVELFDPHEPFHTTREYLDLYGADPDRVFDWPTYEPATESPADVEHVRKTYAALLTMTDRWCGKLLDKLDQLGLFDDTLIVFTTDHGTLLAEHGYWMKNYMPIYNEIVRIPLIVKLPGNARAGGRCGHFSQSIDVMPTFLDHFGCRGGADLPPHLHGRSLLPAASRDEPARADGLFGYFGKATNVTDGRHVYMRMPVNADAGPLHAYTAMPVAGLNAWFPRGTHEKVEMGRYFGHTYNLPVYKFPSTGEAPVPLPGEPPYTGRHLLFDVDRDPKQERPLNDPALERHFIDRLAAHLTACEAPPEQYTRLGLAPR
ncbi:MAG TPA: sulfatase-like hydrolase/transferase [Tepidisphaeraceae bacterium]|nr:sulfatase-like hydrolase/transferase [Tepidisphaeraceae bacterium]